VSGDRWTEIKNLFQAALEREDAGRAGFLDQACGSDPELRAAVERMLAAHARAGAFLETPAFAGAGISAEPPAEVTAPATIGPYRVVREIGRGGMGTVYLAERDDADLRRTVAIKVVNVASPAVVTRFRTEIGVLAGLEHPGIARLYDAAATLAGVPYLVMEFVGGEDLLRYCDGRRASIAERLRLFQRVCAAVQYAHQNLVVHRDLKPSNILVTAAGEPKLLDFGIAKLLSANPENADETAAFARALTPQYSSPEHVRGERATAASDVYSLGVVLYELLTGARPYRITARSAAEIEREVTGQEPAPFSSVVAASDTAAARASTVNGLRQRLQGDLDNIVLKALQKEPARRYPTAAGLAEDIQRHLDGFPVEARPNLLSYRAAKFLRRHRRSVAAGSIAVASLLGGLTIALWQAHAARAERDRATARVHDVQRLANALIFKIHDGVRNLPNSTPVRRMIVEEALRYLEALRTDPAADESLRIELSQAYQRIGVVQGQGNVANLGDRQGAIDSLTKGLDVLRPLMDDPAAHRSAAIQYGRTAVNLAGTRFSAGDKAGAEAAVRDAERVASRLVARSDASEDSKHLLASVHFQYALLTAGPESLAHWKTSGDMFEALLAARPDDPDRQRNVALVNKYLGSIYTDSRDYEAALEHHARARDLDEKRLARDPADRQAQIDVAIDLANTGQVLAQTGRRAEAISEYERSLAIRQRLADSDPRDVFAPGRVAFAHARLGDLYRAAGEIAKSLEHARTAVSLDESLSRLDPTHRNELARALLILGDAERGARDEAAACRHFHKADAIFVELEKQPLTGREAEGRKTSRLWLAGRLAACPH
jgi:non-specific serine/threonine protein kinase/serine/threonine-protein kinase